MKIEDIRQGLEDLAKKHGPAVSNIAKVKEVDEQNATCTLIDEDGQEIFEVRLRPVINENKSLLLLPKVGTYVLAVRIEDDDNWMIIGYDQIEKIGYYIEDCIFEVTSEGFYLKKENETLKKLVSDLIKACKSLRFTVTTTGTATNQAGQTTGIVNINDFIDVENRFNQFLK